VQPFLAAYNRVSSYKVPFTCKAGLNPPTTL